ncbi:MAG: HD domain-containing protein [Clostridia bacterium]|nr:HD domain-containing protein [Clostridia bacterium]
MKKCPDCGMVIANQAIRCPKCKFDFGESTSTPTAVASGTVATVAAPATGVATGILPMAEVTAANVDSFYADLKSQISKRSTEFNHFIDFLENRTAWLSAPAEKEGPMAIEKGLLIRSVGVAKQLLRIKDTLMPQLDDESAIIIGLFHDVGKVGIEGKPLFILEEKPQVTSALGLSLNRTTAPVATPTFTVNSNLVPMEVGVRSLFLVSQYMLLSDDEAQAITYAANTSALKGVPSPYTTVLETAINLQKNVYENHEAIANYSFSVIAP